MCLRLQLPDGSVVSGMDELQDATGRVVPIARGYGAIKAADRRNHCLCPLDLKKLGRRQGWKIDRHSGWSDAAPFADVVCRIR